jgi:hypothetical protein
MRSTLDHDENATMPSAGGLFNQLVAANNVRCGPGTGISHPRPGDLVLIRGTSWASKMILFGERIRFRTPEDRPFAHWSHVALVTTSAGHLLEVGPTGVVVCSIEKYRNHEYHYVHLDLSALARSNAVNFANSCLWQKYGTFSFLLLVLSVVLRDRFNVPDRGEQGCVATIVRALQRAGVTFEQRPTDMTPADVAKRFGVRP